MDKNARKTRKEIRKAINGISEMIEKQLVELLKPYAGETIEFNEPVVSCESKYDKKNGSVEQSTVLLTSIVLFLNLDKGGCLIVGGCCTFPFLRIEDKLKVYDEVLATLKNKGSQSSTCKEEDV